MKKINFLMYFFLLALQVNGQKKIKTISVDISKKVQVCVPENVEINEDTDKIYYSASSFDGTKFPYNSCLFYYKGSAVNINALYDSHSRQMMDQYLNEPIEKTADSLMIKFLKTRHASLTRRSQGCLGKRPRVGKLDKGKGQYLHLGKMNKKYHFLDIVTFSCKFERNEITEKVENAREFHAKIKRYVFVDSVLYFFSCYDIGSESTARKSYSVTLRHFKKLIKSICIKEEDMI